MPCRTIPQAKGKVRSKGNGQSPRNKAPHAVRSWPSLRGLRGLPNSRTINLYKNAIRFSHRIAFFYFSGSSAHRGRRCRARTMLHCSSSVPAASHMVAYHMGLRRVFVSGSNRCSGPLAYWKCRWLNSPPDCRAVRCGIGSIASRQRNGQSAATFSAMKSAFSLPSRPRSSTRSRW